MNIDPKNVRLSDINSVYPPNGKGDLATNSMTHLVDDIKKKSGTDKLYLKREDVEKAMNAETDPNKKAIFEWINDNFTLIDKSKAGINNAQTNWKDGFIGAGDLEKYFGINK